MSDHTSIEWTDATWNPITGCSVISPGCKNCYAMKLAGGRLQHHPSRAGLTQPSAAGPVWTGQVRFNEAAIDEPRTWRKPRMIFVCAHGDLFHESVPDEWIDQVFGVMAGTSRHTFQVLTKRAKRMRAYLERFKLSPPKDGFVTRDGVPHNCVNGGPVFHPNNWPLKNVWLGVSAEDQERANERIPELLATLAAVHWVSLEPLLGPVDLTEIEAHRRCGVDVFSALEYEGAIGDDVEFGTATLDWVVVGGESGTGQGVRPMHPDWARGLRDQCAAAGVPFLFKQWGAWLPVDIGSSGEECYAEDGSERAFEGRLTVQRLAGYLDVARVGKKAAGRLLDGVQHDGFPA